jgi:hypothetical protein
MEMNKDKDKNLRVMTTYIISPLLSYLLFHSFHGDGMPTGPASSGPVLKVDMIIRTDWSVRPLHYGITKYSYSSSYSTSISSYPPSHILPSLFSTSFVYSYASFLLISVVLNFID